MRRSDAVFRQCHHASELGYDTGRLCDRKLRRNTVENFGTITGDVSLIDTGGGSSFINHAGALFNSGASVQAGHVTNDGVSAPSGRGTIETTVLGDQLVQTGTGVFAVDVDVVAGTYILAFRLNEGG